MFDALFPSHWSDIQKLMWLKILNGGSAVWATITGNPVSFSAKAAPLRQLKVAFSPKQEGSGDPSPDNVRPISGWSSLTVYHSGADTSDPRSISISLGSTVYSGYVDVVTGVLTADYAEKKVKDLSWSYSSAQNMFYATLTGYAEPETGSVIPKILCDTYQPVSINTITGVAKPNATISLGKSGNWNNYILIRDTDYSDAASFKTAMGDVEFIYELATPIPIQLTPQEVQSLAGDNVLFSDANGNLTVEYRSN